MASVRPITQFLVRIPNSSPTTIMMIARVRQNRICTSGGRSRTLTRGWSSRAGAAGRRPPPLIPNGPGLLSGADSTGRIGRRRRPVPRPAHGDRIGRPGADRFHDRGGRLVGGGAVRRAEVQGRLRAVGHLAGRDVAEDRDAVVGGPGALRGLGRVGRRRPRDAADVLIDAGVRGPDRAEAPAGAPVVPGDRASWLGFSATAYRVPATPVFWLLWGGGSASAAGVTVACTPVCGCVPGCADDLEFLIRGQAIHLTISAYRFGRR